MQNFKVVSLHYFIIILEQEYKKPLVDLNKATVGTNVEEFLIAAENALQASSMILKKIDKKKDKYVEIVFNHYDN